MMKKRLMAALMAATMAMSLAACGGGDAPAGGSDNASNEPYKIRMTLKTNAAEFWNIIQAGAQKIVKGQQLALKNGAPVIALNDSGGAR